MSASSKSWASLWKRIEPEATKTVVSRPILLRGDRASTRRQALARLAARTPTPEPRTRYLQQDPDFEPTAEPSPDFRSAFEGEEDAELYLDLSEVFAEQERAEGFSEDFELNEPVTFFEVESVGSDHLPTVELPTIDPLIDPEGFEKTR